MWTTHYPFLRWNLEITKQIAPLTRKISTQEGFVGQALNYFICSWNNTVASAVLDKLRLFENPQIINARMRLAEV